MTTRRSKYSVLIAFMASVTASCIRPIGAGLADEQSASPPICTDSDVVAKLVDMANTHPDYSLGFSSPAVFIADITETKVQEFSNPRSFRRLCTGQMTLESGEVLGIGWEIFTTDASLLPLYGITPCFGKYDLTGRDCTAYSEGTLPGEPAPTPSPTAKSFLGYLPRPA